MFGSISCAKFSSNFRKKSLYKDGIFEEFFQFVQNLFPNLPEWGFQLEEGDLHITIIYPHA